MVYTNKSLGHVSVKGVGRGRRASNNSAAVMAVVADIADTLTEPFHGNGVGRSLLHAEICRLDEKLVR